MAKIKFLKKIMLKTDDGGIKFPLFPDHEEEEITSNEPTSVENISSEPPVNQGDEIKLKDKPSNGFEKFLTEQAEQNIPFQLAENVNEDKVFTNNDSLVHISESEHLTVEEVIFTIVNSMKESSELIDLIAKKAAKKLFAAMNEEQRIYYLRTKQQLNAKVKDIIEIEEIRQYKDALNLSFNKLLQQLMIEVN